MPDPRGEIKRKSERLAEIFRRMSEAPACSSFETAHALLCSTMDEVEDELTDFPNEPERYMAIPRLFPPRGDRMSSVGGCDVKRFDSLRHVTYIASNGAIEIRTMRVVNGQIRTHFRKEGSDGRFVDEICPELKKKNA